MKAVSETKRFNDSWAKRMAYGSYMDKVRWNNALKEEAEAQRKQDEAYRRETERIAAEAAHEKEEAAARLRKAYRNLLAAGMEASKAAELLGLDPSVIPPSAEQ